MMVPQISYPASGPSSAEVGSHRLSCVSYLGAMPSAADDDDDDDDEEAHREED
jgi:hypothetical protein